MTTTGSGDRVAARASQAAEVPEMASAVAAELVAMDAVELVAAELTAVAAALRAVLPSEVVLTDPDRLEGYRFDRAMFCPAGVPAAVVLARETAQVQAALRVASRLGVPVVAQGGRSGLSGAANAIEGCIVISTERMNRVLEIDVANRLVVTQPGIFNADLSRAVAGHGLFYPPDPSSWEFCTIGGNLSTTPVVCAA